MTLFSRWLKFTAVTAFLIATVWAATQYEKAAYALIVVVFGFFGFYLSEIAKQAIRARHLANQGWVYLQNSQYTVQLETSWDFFRAIAQEWHAARRAFQAEPANVHDLALDYTQVDKAFRERINGLIGTPEHQQRLVQHFQFLMSTPGKVESAIEAAKRGLDRLSEWNDLLPDSEVALLGPEILLHTLNYRTSMNAFWQRELALNTYLKHAKEPVPAHFLVDVQSLSFYAVKSQVELEMLRPLVAAAREKSLVQLSMSLLR